MKKDEKKTKVSYPFFAIFSANIYYYTVVLKSKWSQQALPVSNPSQQQPPSSGFAPLTFQIFSDDAVPSATVVMDKNQEKHVAPQSSMVATTQGTSLRCIFNF